MSPASGRRVQRVAAYAVVLRGDKVLLSRLAPRVSREELWTLPGGRIEHAEDPRLAVVREVREETGLDVTISETAHVYSQHHPRGAQDPTADTHAIRIVFEGWVPLDADEPRVLEVDGSTVASAWVRLSDVLERRTPTTALVRQALTDYRPFPLRRVAAYALVRRVDTVLLTRVSPRGFHTGLWTLPGGGLEAGESPTAGLVREMREECGLDCRPGQLLVVADEAVRGAGPSGRDEQVHSVQIVYAATVPVDGEPVLGEQDGTADAVAWVAVADIESGAVPVHPLVRQALTAG